MRNSAFIPFARRHTAYAAAFVALSSPVAAHAQGILDSVVSGIPVGETFEPRAISSNGVFITPTVTIAIGRNDNVNLTETGKTASSFLTVMPEVNAVFPFRDQKIEIGARSSHTVFGSSSANSTNTAEIAAVGTHPLDARNGVTWRGGYQHGTDAATVVSGTPNRWDAVSLGGVYRYGAQDAILNAEGELGAQVKRYSNNRDITQASDINNYRAALRGFYRVAPKTRLMAEYRLTKNDLINNTSVSNLDHKVLFGVDWDASAAISGRVAVGYQLKDYKSVVDQNSLTYEGGLKWSPVERTQFDFSAQRSIVEPTVGYGNGSTQSTADITWRHQWLPYVASTASYSFGINEAVNGTRQDDVNTLRLGVSYDFRRWLRLGANYEYLNTSSNTAGYSHDRNLFSLTLQAGL